MREQPANPDRAVGRIAARQHGVITVGQLREAGIDKDRALRRVRAGHLHRVHLGIYAVGHPRLSFEGRCQAAVLACGDRSVLSHCSAAVLWGLSLPAPGPIDVTVNTSSGRRSRPGIAVHRSLSLTSEAITRRSGIPVTNPARTLRDLRRVATPAVLQRAIRRAVDLRLVTSESLGPEPELTRSELERLFLRLCRRHRLPDPEVNARIGRVEVDFLWREQALIVETDGYRYHASRASFESDRARDVQLQALGYRVLRFTYRQLCASPRSVVGSIRSLMRRAGAP